MAKRRSKGAGSVFKKNNGYYVYRYTDGNGMQRQKALRTKNRAEAEELAQGFTEAVKAKDKKQVLFQAAEANRIIHKKDLILADVWNEFLKTKPTAGTGTLALYQRSLNEFIGWLALNRPSIASFSQIELETAITYMESVWESGVSASTYNDKRNALGHITKKLQNRFNIEFNAWMHTERKKAVQQKRLPLNRKQINELLELLGEPTNGLPYPIEMACLVKLCLFAGMRLIDAVNIKWENINFETGYISYVPEKTKRTSGVTAQVPILPPLHDALNALDNSSDYVLAQIQGHYVKNADYIKENVLNAIHTITGDQRNIDTAQSKRKRSLYGAHSLRHTFCTEAAKAGANSVQLSTMTGDLISTLDKFYIKLDRTQKPVKTFSKVLEKRHISTDPEREQLHQLTDILPLDAVRQILNTFQRG
ncbi:MAG: site-specific integrase [Victivallales bacterium]|nr:site-specific integrase [Victivallales bacterium]